MASSNKNMNMIIFLPLRTYHASGEMNIDKVSRPEEVMVASHRKYSFKERMARRKEKKSSPDKWKSIPKGGAGKVKQHIFI